jgi:hypothetical protein
VVGVSYGGVQGLVVAIRIRVCPAIIPESVWGQIRVWNSKARRGVRVPLPEHAGHSLLWHPKSRSCQNVLPHESDRNKKLLTELSDLANHMVQFCRF